MQKLRNFVDDEHKRRHFYFMQYSLKTLKKSAKIHSKENRFFNIRNDSIKHKNIEKTFYGKVFFTEFFFYHF